MFQKHYPICHLERKIHRLNTDEYEYRPAYYEEVRCTMTSGGDFGVTNEVNNHLLSNFNYKGENCLQFIIIFLYVHAIIFDEHLMFFDIPNCVKNMNTYNLFLYVY